VRGLGKLGNAYISEWTAKREAKAEATRLAIETDVKVKTDAALADARREQELAEFEHRAALERRAQRFRVEMVREQINVEAIERRALEYTERDPDNGNAREIEEDWLFKFADLAQKVSDEDVQALWARALSSASIEGRPRLSAAALQTLSLFDKEIAESFGKFVGAYSRLGGFVPHLPEGQTEPQQIELATLVDLGLIREILQNAPLEFIDFKLEQTGNVLKMTQAALALTKRGYDIATAVFHSVEDIPLSERDEEAYLTRVLQQQVRRFRIATLVAKGDAEPPIIVRISGKTNSPPGIPKPDWTSSERSEKLSARLIRILAKMEQSYDIKVE